MPGFCGLFGFCGVLGLDGVWGMLGAGLPFCFGVGSDGVWELPLPPQAESKKAVAMLNPSACFFILRVSNIF